MRMPRPQFSIRTILWLTLVAAAFLGGMAFEKERRRREDDELINRSDLDHPFTKADFSIWIPQDQTLEDALSRRRKNLDASKSPATQE